MSRRRTSAECQGRLATRAMFEGGGGGRGRHQGLAGHPATRPVQAMAYCYLGHGLLLPGGLTPPPPPPERSRLPLSRGKGQSPVSSVLILGYLVTLSTKRGKT